MEDMNMVAHCVAIGGVGMVLGAVVSWLYCVLAAGSPSGAGTGSAPGGGDFTGTEMPNPRTCQCVRRHDGKDGDVVTAEIEVIPEIGEYVKVRGVYAGINRSGKHLYVRLKDHLMEMSWSGMMKQYKPENLPTIEDLVLIYIHNDKINAGLIAAGGQPLKEDGFYWSSTEIYYNYAWKFSMHNGRRYSTSKYSSNGYVRPVRLLG